MPITPPDSSKRRRPHCHQCKSPMLGHKRGANGSPICPSQQTRATRLSFPPSPAHSPSPAPSKTRRISEPSFTIPSHGPWHRRNPNWVDAAPTFRPISPVGSYVSTVLVDSDGNTINGSVVERKHVVVENEAEHDWEDEDVFLAQPNITEVDVVDPFSGLGEPVVSIFATKQEDILRASNTAAQLGVHSGVVHAPLKKFAMNGVNSETAGIKREHSWWLVLGKSLEAVNYIVDVQEKGMPGTIAESELREGPMITTFFQLVVAGIIGGVVVFCGLGLSML